MAATEQVWVVIDPGGSIRDIFDNQAGANSWLTQINALRGENFGWSVVQYPLQSITTVTNDDYLATKHIKK